MASLQNQTNADGENSYEKPGMPRTVIVLNGFKLIEIICNKFTYFMHKIFACLVLVPFEKRDKNSRNRFKDKLKIVALKFYCL